MVIKILNKEREEREGKETNQVFSSPSSFQQQQRPPLKKQNKKIYIDINKVGSSKKEQSFSFIKFIKWGFTGIEKAHQTHEGATS
jgi:hypothetical protein